MVVILIATYVMTLLLSFLTGNRRALRRQQAHLSQALGAVTRAADQRVQAPLASTLLSLGHSLPGPKTYQPALRPTPS